MNDFEQISSLIKILDKEDSEFHADFTREVKEWFKISPKKKQGKFYYNEELQSENLLDLYEKILKADLESKDPIRIKNHWTFLDETTLINSFDKWDQDDIKEILCPKASE